MSDIRFRCLACKSKLTVDGHGAGKTIACPRCGAAVTIPQKSTIPPRGPSSVPGAPDESDALRNELAELRSAAAQEREAVSNEFLSRIKSLEAERDRIKNELNSKAQAVDNITTALKNEREVRERQEREAEERVRELQSQVDQKDQALRAANEERSREDETAEREAAKRMLDELAEMKSAREKSEEELRTAETMLRNERQTRKKLEEEHLTALEGVQNELEEERRGHAAEVERLTLESEGLRGQAAGREAHLIQVKESLASRDKQIEEERGRVRLESARKLEATRASLAQDAARSREEAQKLLRDTESRAEQDLNGIRELLRNETHAREEERTAHAAEIGRLKAENEALRGSVLQRESALAEIKESVASSEHQLKEERERSRVKQEQAVAEAREAVEAEWAQRQAQSQSEHQETAARAKKELQGLRESLDKAFQAIEEERARRELLERQAEADRLVRAADPMPGPPVQSSDAGDPAPEAAARAEVKSASQAGGGGVSAGIVLGWLCLITGIVIMVLSPVQVVFYGAALAAAMMIGLVLLLRRRSPVVYGLIGMTLLAPGILYLGSAYDGFDGLLPARDETEEDLPRENPRVETPVVSPDPMPISAIGVGESFTIDRVRVTFTGVRTGPVTIRDVLGKQASPKKEFLLVDLTLEAVDTDELVHVKQPWERTRLVDENSTSIYVVPEQRLSLDHVEGTLRSAQLVPGKRFADMLVFELPEEGAAEFHVISDPGIYRISADGLDEPVSADTLHLRFSREEIVRNRAS